MVDENLTDEQLLEITGGNVFLWVDSNSTLPISIIHALYSISPIRPILLYAVQPIEITE